MRVTLEIKRIRFRINDVTHMTKHVIWLLLQVCAILLRIVSGTRSGREVVRKSLLSALGRFLSTWLSQVASWAVVPRTEWFSLVNWV